MNWCKTCKAELPNEPMCNVEPECKDCKIKRMEAKCAEMRKALERIRFVNPMLDKPISEQIKENEALWFHALSPTDCGNGWRSPEEWAAMEAKCEKMREALLRVPPGNPDSCGRGVWIDGATWCEAMQLRDRALQLLSDIKTLKMEAE